MKSKPNKKKSVKKDKSGEKKSGRNSKSDQNFSDSKKEADKFSGTKNSQTQQTQNAEVLTKEKSETETLDKASKSFSSVANSDESDSQRPDKKSFFSSRINPHLAFILILLFQTAIILVFSAPLDEAEKSIIKIFSMFNSAPAGNDRVEIVDINDDDRRVLFDGKNDPLTPSKLYEIIQAIADNEPKLIGIDIDTSNEQFKSLQLLETNIPIVWAETPVLDENRKVIGTLEPVGGLSLPNGHHSGVPASPRDSDNVQRFYQRFVKIANTETPTLPFKVVSLVDSDANRTTTSDMDKRYIGFVNQPRESFNPHISATDLLEKTKKGSLATEHSLKDKIVLLGGSFSGQDRTDTPVGQMLGIDVQSAIIETELAGGGREPLNMFVKIIFIVITSLVMLYIFHVNEMRDAILWSLLVIAATSIFVGLIFQDIIGSLILFGAFLISLFAQIIDKIRDSVKVKVSNQLMVTETSNSKIGL